MKYTFLLIINIWLHVLPSVLADKAKHSSKLKSWQLQVEGGLVSNPKFCIGSASSTFHGWQVGKRGS